MKQIAYYHMDGDERLVWGRCGNIVEEDYFVTQRDLNYMLMGGKHG